MIKNLSLSSFTSAITQAWQTTREYFEEEKSTPENHLQYHSINYKRLIVMGAISLLSSRTGLGLGLGLLFSELPSVEAAFSAVMDLNTLNASTGVILQGRTAGDNFGWTVSTLGDINGDGISDLLIGAYNASPFNRTNAGEVYILFGRNEPWPAIFDLNSLNTSTGVILQGRASGDWAGSAISALGDINGDGITDIIIGAEMASPPSTTNAGEVYILFGRNGSWPEVFDLNSLDATTGVIIQGRATDDYAGRWVSSLGDVNGDKVPDIFIGAFGADPLSRQTAGEAYIIFGRNSSWPAILDLNTLDASTGVILQGRSADDQTGVSVSYLGDVNGDGIVDMMVGAPYANPFNGTTAGAGYIIFGRNSNWPDTFDLNTLNTNTGVILNGRVPGDIAGISVSALGDVNGDGIVDMVMGAYGASPFNRANAGEIYILFGRNGSWPAIVDLASLNVSTGVIIQGGAMYDRMGYAVSFIKDINGDGIDDILFGAPLGTLSNREYAGTVYLLYGRNGSWPATIDLNSLNASIGLIIEGRVAGDQLGYSVGGIDDVNGDGVPDLLMGARYANPLNRTTAGEAYIIFGQRNLIPTPTAALTSTSTSSSSISMPEPIPAPFPIPAPALIVTSSPVVGPVSTFMSSTSVSSPTDSISETAPNDNKALYIGIGIGVGVLAVAAATAIGIFAVKRKHTCGKKEDESIEMNSQEETHLPVRASIQAGI